MLLGLCASISEIKEVKALGFDFIEPVLLSLETVGNAELKKMADEIRELAFFPLCFNCLFPASIPLLGEDANHNRIQEYLNNVFPKAAALGGKTVVFGSGGARRRPDDLAPERAFEQLVAVTRILGDVAAKNGITIAIEPLQPGDTNMITSLSQGRNLVPAVNHSSVRLLADNYHMANSNDSVDELAQNIDLLCHIHVASVLSGDPSVRNLPDEEDTYKTEPFIHALRKTGYRGTISLECLPAKNSREKEEAQRVMRHWLTKKADSI